MIFTDRTIIVQKGTSSINDTIILYRGDKDIEIRFTLNEGSPFKFGSGASPNIIEKTEAAYGQLVIKTPNDLPSIFSEVVPTNEGKIVFTITAEMIDEITEVGNYTFQIRLLDESRNSRATLPEVVNGIEIREPIATEDVSSTNEVGAATVGYALTTAGTTEDAFDTQGNYNKTTWAAGDRITDAKLNKMEAAIDGVNQKVASGGTGGNNAGDISIADTGNYFISTNVEGALQEAGSQIKDLANVGKPTDEQVANVINQAIADGTLSVSSIVFKDITTSEIFEVEGSTGGSGGSTGGSGGSTGGSGGSTGSEKLNLSITDGLTHLYDFQTLTSSSTVANDLVGTDNITYASGFATDGGILSKPQHLNCGNLLDDEFTAFLTMKLDNNYNGVNAEYLFYCGDRTLIRRGNKIGPSTSNNASIIVREGVVYTLAVKWDNTSKTMYSYINGELRCTTTATSFSSNDRAVYISFDNNTNTGINYNMAIYNQKLTDEDIKTISSELYGRVHIDKSNVGLSITDNLQCFYDMTSIGESATYIESKVGEHRLNINNGYTFNNGLILGTSSNLSEADTAPHSNKFTYFLKSTIPSTSTRGNKVIESQKAFVTASKSQIVLTVSGVATNAITPELDVSNVIAISVDNVNKEAKLYYKGELKQTITFTDDCLALNGDYYMLANDIVHHNLVLYDRVLSGAEVETVTSELEAI